MTDIAKRLRAPVLVERDDGLRIEAAAEIERLREALAKIANGDGAYGAQAFEYKQIARAALRL